MLAESPSQAVIYVPDNVGVGSKTLKIEDAAGGKLEQPLTLVQINMTANQLKLQKGQMTNGRVTIEGADASLAGGVLHIQNMSPETVTLRAPGAVQTIPYNRCAPRAPARG